jgi:hypothetical protein
MEVALETGSSDGRTDEGRVVSKADVCLARHFPMQGLPANLQQRPRCYDQGLRVETPVVDLPWRWTILDRVDASHIVDVLVVIGSVDLD